MITRKRLFEIVDSYAHNDAVRILNILAADSINGRAAAILRSAARHLGHRSTVEAWEELRAAQADWDAAR